MKAEYFPFDDDDVINQGQLFAVEPLPTGSVFASILQRQGARVDFSKGTSEGKMRVVKVREYG